MFQARVSNHKVSVSGKSSGYIMNKKKPDLMETTCVTGMITVVHVRKQKRVFQRVNPCEDHF